MTPFLRLTSTLLILTSLAACATPTAIVKTETVEVTKIVPVPAELTAPCSAPPLSGQGELTVKDVLIWAMTNRAALSDCDQRMAKVRALGPQP